MADSFGVRLTGDEAVGKMFDQLETKLQKKSLTKSTRHVAKSITLVAAQKLVPVREKPYTDKYHISKGRKPGDLKKSMIVRAAKTKKNTRLPRHIVGHAVTWKGGKKSLFVGDSFYGGILEFGRKSGSESRGGPIKAVKFLRRALYDNASRAKAVFRTEVGKQIKEIARETLAKSKAEK